MNGKNSFVLYCDIGQHLDLLSNEDAGLLFKSIVHYVDTGELPHLPPMAEMAFSFIRAQIDRDQVKWRATREKRKSAGRAGGIKSGESRQKGIEANEANASSAKQSQANEAVPVNVPVPVNGNVPVPVIDIRERKADKPPRQRFQPPTEDEAIEFFSSVGSSTQEAKSFFDYYTANGWKVGKNSMKDWKAAARNWIRRAGAYSGSKTQPQKPTMQDALALVDEATDDLNHGIFPQF